MKSYPDKALIIDSLIEAAKTAAYLNDVEHPEDIASAMSAAIDASAPAIMHFYQHGEAKQ